VHEYVVESSCAQWGVLGMARDKTKPLSIPLFPQDFIGSGDVMAMSYEQVGCYIFLLCIAWQASPPCTIPADEKLQANLLKLPLLKWRKIAPGVLVPWVDVGEGRLGQERLRREYDYLTNKLEAASNAGAAGGLASAAKRKLNKGSTTVERPLNDRTDSASSGIQPPNPYPSPSQLKQTTTTTAREESLSGIELTEDESAAADKIFAAATDAMRPKGNAANGWVLPLHEANRLSGIIDATMKAGTAFISEREWHPWELADEYAAAVRGSNPAGVNGLCNFIDAVWKRCQRSGCKPGDPHKVTGLAIEKTKPKNKTSCWDVLEEKTQ